MSTRRHCQGDGRSCDSSPHTINLIEPLGDVKATCTLILGTSRTTLFSPTPILRRFAHQPHQKQVAKCARLLWICSAQSSMDAGWVGLVRRGREWGGYFYYLSHLTRSLSARSLESQLKRVEIGGDNSVAMSLSFGWVFGIWLETKRDKI